MKLGHQIMVRAIIADLEAQHGPTAVLPITAHLARADEELRALYQRAALRRASQPAGEQRA